MAYSDVALAIEQSPTAQAYLAVETERGERRFMLGPKTDLEAEIPMLDWRTSPARYAWAVGACSIASATSE